MAGIFQFAPLQSVFKSKRGKEKERKKEIISMAYSSKDYHNLSELKHKLLTMKLSKYYFLLNGF